MTMWPFHPKATTTHQDHDAYIMWSGSRLHACCDGIVLESPTSWPYCFFALISTTTDLGATE